MKNYLLTFLLAVLVVLTGITLRRVVAGIGGAPMPPLPKLAIGGAPMPPLPKAIGGAPMPPLPKATVETR